jgi:hypothetical protein
MDQSPKSGVIAACRVLLRPIVRLLLRSGIPWKDFAELGKTSYVEVATDEYGIRGRPTNASRVAILSGLSRREVARQRDILAAADATSDSAFLNPAQRVLTGWHQDPDYLSADGTPREIEAEGAAPSFQDLCLRYAGDIPATALLKELRKVAAVVPGQGGRCKVLQRVYFPAQFDTSKVLRAGSVLEDIGNTVVYDLLSASGERLRFERRAENDRIDPRHQAAFQSMLEKEGQAFLERVDAWLTEHEVKAGSTDAQAPRVMRLGVGVYHIQTDMERGAKK